MRKLWFIFPLLLSGTIPARGQTVVGRQVLAGSGTDVATVVATDSQGFVYVAGYTTSIDFPVKNALESQPPQGALEVSVNGAPFVNADINASAANMLGDGARVAAASSDGKVVLVGAGENLYRSTDGGVTWSAVAVLPDLLALAVDPANPSTAYALGLGGVLMQSTDGGVTWQGITSPPNIFPGGGPNKYSYFIPPGGAQSITIDPQNPATLYVWASAEALVFGPDTVYSSTDGAQSWQQVQIPGGQALAFAMAPSQPNVLYAVAATGALLKSTDGGSTWTAGATINAGYAPALAVDPTNASIVWVTAADGALEKSTDGGATLQTITTLGNSPGASAIAIDPANHLRVYVTTSSGVSESSDGGATWSTVLSGYAGGLYAAPSRVYELGGVPSTVFLAKLDPALSQVIYCTYLWTGSVTGIAVDVQGNVALTGLADPGSGIVMKVNWDDSAVIYSHILTGTVPNAIAMDAEGNAVIVGSTFTLAATNGVFQTAPPGKCASPPVVNGTPQSPISHAFATKLNASGGLVYATYVTGSCGDSAYGLALDSSGDAYVGGETYSPDFPVTQNAMTAKFPGVTSSGFVTKLSPTGNSLYSSFVGGGGYTAVHAVKLDGAGDIYLAGSTEASPTAGAVHALSAGVGCNAGVGSAQQGDDAFVLKMTASAAPPAFLATIGGSCTGEAESLALDAAGDIWLAGSNGSADFVLRAPIAGLSETNPAQKGLVHPHLQASAYNGFVAELNPTASNLLYANMTTSSFYGTVAADSTAVYYAGPWSQSVQVAEVNPTQVATIFLDEIVQDSPLLSPAQRLPSPVAPGEIVRLLGRGIGPQKEVDAKLTAAGTMPTSLGGVQVTFNGVPAPLVTAQANQIECIAPFELADTTTAVVEVQYNGQATNAYTVGVYPQNVDILAIVNSDWSVNSPSNPAKPGSLVVIFLTGLGQTVPASSDGAINQVPPAQLQTMPSIFFQYAPVDVNFIGAAAFEVAGVSQLNLTLPNPAASPFAVYIGGTLAIGTLATIYIAQ
jgi:uncharacterized protein (TIGR03437 family)